MTDNLKFKPIFILWLEKSEDGDKYIPCNGIYIEDPSNSKEEIRMFFEFVKSVEENWKNINFFIFQIERNDLQNNTQIEIITSIVENFEKRDELCLDYITMSGEELFCLCS